MLIVILVYSVRLLFTLLQEEMPLPEVFLKIKEKENGRPTSISHKDCKDVLEEYFFEVLPDYDEDQSLCLPTLKKLYSGITFYKNTIF